LPAARGARISGSRRKGGKRREETPLACAYVNYSTLIIVIL